MPTHLPKEPVIAALHDVWDRLDSLLAGLDDADWKRPSADESYKDTVSTITNLVLRPVTGSQV